MKFVKYLAMLCGVIGLFACSDRPSNLTAHHCLSNTQCNSNEVCATWSSPVGVHEYRDGLCRTLE